MALGHKGFAPAFESFSVVLAERILLDHMQTGRVGVGPKGAGAWEAAAGKNVLLDKVGGGQVTLKQCVINHNALDAGGATGLQEFGDCFKVGGPKFFANGFNHLHRANRIKGRVIDVAVVLQAQVRFGAQAQTRHALAGEL